MRNPAAVYGDPVALDVDYVGGKSARNLAYRLRVSQARTGPQVPSG
jgi:hypothetical protein